MEYLYGQLSPKDEQSLIDLAIKKAQAMGLELYASDKFAEDVAPLKSTRLNAADIEYEDGSMNEKITDGRAALIYGKRIA